MIRAARFQDVPRCLEILEAAHEHSIYAAAGAVDRGTARTLFESVCARTDSEDNERTLFQVSQKSGKVEGFLLAIIQPVYLVGDKNETTDIFTLLSKRADPGDFLKLLAAYKKWTAEVGAIEARAAITDIMGEQWERLLPIYEKLGFERCGVIYRWRPA